ncbi:hypothetical protein FB451DRAFT_1139768 [Mycena latifolia]|nr:hypothetical protein FB451DRAFT_1139768 [Mycena latifolia]
MPSFNQTIDVTSPLIQYSGPWVPGGQDTDGEANKNDMGTFTICAGVDCTATINFTGTEIYVMGAYRVNSLPYKVTLDGAPFGPFTPVAPPEQFKIPLFNKTGLPAGAHSVKIQNVESTDPSKTTMDLDFVSWTTEINSSGDLRIQDDAPAFSYEPAGAWNTDVENLHLPNFDDGTGHATTLDGATATLTFMGDRVALYGALGAQGGPYTVQVDGGSPPTFNSQTLISNTVNSKNYLPAQMIFYVDSLPLGKHTVTVTAKPTSATQGLTIDYAIVDGTVNSTPTSKPNTLSHAALGGIIAAGTVVALCALVALFYVLYWRRRRRAKVLPEEINMLDDSTYAPRPFSPPREISPPRYEEPSVDYTPSPYADTPVPSSSYPMADVHRDSPSIRSPTQAGPKGALLFPQNGPPVIE